MGPESRLGNLGSDTPRFTATAGRDGLRVPCPEQGCAGNSARQFTQPEFSSDLQAG